MPSSNTARLTARKSPLAVVMTSVGVTALRARSGSTSSPYYTNPFGEAVSGLTGGIGALRGLNSVAGPGGISGALGLGDLFGGAGATYGGGGALGALLTATPSVDSGVVGTFSSVAYTTGLTITDSTAMGSPHTFNFSGVLNGTLDPGTNTLSNSFTTPTTQTFTLGSNTYTVSINQLALPGIGTNGAVTYDIQVSGANGDGGPAPAPEPSTLALMASSGALAFLRFRRRS